MQVTKNRSGRAEKHLKLESAILEGAFDVVVESTANDATLTESSVVWRHT
jgi:hypothetical protein